MTNLLINWIFSNKILLYWF